jgi:hypothetical protein
LENNEKGMTYTELQQRFFGSDKITEEEDEQLYSFLDANMEDNMVFIEINIRLSINTFYK